MTRTHYLVLAIVTGLAAPAAAQDDDDGGGSTIHLTHAHPQFGSREFDIDTLSARDVLISGGDVLVRVGVDARFQLADVVVSLNGHEVTGAFHADGTTHALVGLVSGLHDGDNLLDVRIRGLFAFFFGPHTFLVVTNHPITGPILSGPHLTPYECRTVQSNLGAPLDADCSAATRFDWFYRTTANNFKPLTNPTGPRPVDLVSTTTNDGVTGPFIVR